MRKITGLFLSLLLSISLFAQIHITDPGFPPTSPLPCSSYLGVGSANFYDDGGSANNYSANANYVFTVCPDIPNGTPKISVSFGGQGLIWDVHESDTLYVYDGPNTSSPLLGAYNNGTDPGGFGIASTFANATGCLTFVFVSDAADEGAGWEANLRCYNPGQPFDIHMEAYINGEGSDALVPADTGYVNLCQGDSVLFVATPEFPYSLENTGNGYSQTPSNVNYLWEFSDGTVGPNASSVWFKPPLHSGYFIRLSITDNHSYSQNIKSRVRVSTTPFFTGTGAKNDTICFGQTTNLLGGVTASDTVGTEIPGNTFQIGGEYAGETFLPDGNNDIYSTSINISGFPPGSIVQNGSDIVSMCVNMEHSYMGDLEMWLECPDGTYSIIFDAYPQSSGNFPGGFTPGKTLLGEPDNGDGTGPGNGYTYCFSSINNNWGTFATEYQTNTIPTPPSAPYSGNTMNPNGIYTPEMSFNNFIGCPLNGSWTLKVKDNWSIDDGYIFSWNIDFDPSLYPDNETYQNYEVEAYWNPAPTIVSDLEGDTLIVINPFDPGTSYQYTYNIIDNFGCHYDTTIAVVVLDTIINMSILDTTLYCYSDSIPLWVHVEDGYNKPYEYAWAAGSTSDTLVVGIQENGIFYYEVIGTDKCGFTTIDSAIVRMNQTLSIDTMFQTPADCGMNNGVLQGFTSGNTGLSYYEWRGPGTETQSHTDASVWEDRPSGWYYFTVEDQVCMAMDSIFLEQNPPPEAKFNANPSSGSSPLSVTFVNNSDEADSYDWNFGNGDGALVYDLSDQYSEYIEPGVYTVTLIIYAGACSDEDTKTVTVYEPLEFDSPNVFTPNGDGDNDIFSFNIENAVSFSLVILNRWGNVVFETNDPNLGWNGKVQNSGPDCTEGTYFYKYKIEGQGDQEAEGHGFIELIRGK